MKAFSSGCTALTGVEAVSDGIPNFRRPAQKNAKKVLTLLALIVLLIFGGVCALAAAYKVQAALNRHETLTVVLPQFVISKWWHNPLHNQTALLLKTSLYKRRNVAVITIPYIINE